MKTFKLVIAGGGSTHRNNVVEDQGIFSLSG